MLFMDCEVRQEAIVCVTIPPGTEWCMSVTFKDFTSAATPSSKHVVTKRYVHLSVLPCGLLQVPVSESVPSWDIMKLCCLFRPIRHNREP